MAPPEASSYTPGLMASRNKTTINIYLWVFGGIILALGVRNLIIKSTLFFARSRRPAPKPGLVQFNEPLCIQESIFNNGNSLYRIVKSLDKIGNFIVHQNLLGPKYTLFRLVFSFFIIAFNVVAWFLMVEINSDRGSSYVSKRMAAVGLANLPILFLLAGRNSWIGFITGFTYHEIKPYHKLVGILTLLEMLGHSGIYIYRFQPNWDVYIKREFVYMGVVATVAMATLGITSFPVFRNRTYQLFFISHIIGTIGMIVGCWYHFNSLRPYLKASIAIWGFDRAVRMLSHVFTIFNKRIILRLPVIKAKAQLLSGAIVLRVPMASEWEGGSHFFVSFWGKELLAMPWMIGQAHPFSVANHPVLGVQSKEQEMIFVIKVQKGLTASLSRYIQRNSFDGSGIDVHVTVEGPYNGMIPTDQYESVLFMAGGSGITHSAALLAGTVEEARLNQKKPRLYLEFSVTRKNQIGWISATLATTVARAREARIPLSMNIYVTRDADPMMEKTSHTLVSIDDLQKMNVYHEEKSHMRYYTVPLNPGVEDETGAIISYGRPDFGMAVEKVYRECSGHMLVLGCGPAGIESAVRETQSKLKSNRVHVEFSEFRM